MTRGILLDTHVLVAHVTKTQLLGKTSRHLLGQQRPLSYSPLSIAEMRLKEDIKQKSFLSDTVILDLNRAGYRELPLTSEAATGITRFPSLRRHDPFDRLLLAQAAHHTLLFVTADRTLIDLDLPFVHDARQ